MVKKLKTTVGKFIGMAAISLSKQATPEEGWPPPCMGVLYQPKRPVSVKTTKGSDK